MLFLDISIVQVLNNNICNALGCLYQSVHHDEVKVTDELCVKHKIRGDVAITNPEYQNYCY